MTKYHVLKALIKRFVARSTVVRSSALAAWLHLFEKYSH